MERIFILDGFEVLLICLGAEEQKEKLPSVFFPLDKFPISKSKRADFEYVLFWERRGSQEKHRVNLSRYTDNLGKEWLKWLVQDDVMLYPGKVKFYFVGLSRFCERLQSPVYTGLVGAVPEGE